MQRDPATASPFASIDTAMSASEARRTMLRLGVSWLTVCERDCVVGTIEEAQLAALASTDMPVTELASANHGQVRWLTPRHRSLTIPPESASA
jgi:predicted transcriptional regulator